MIRWDRLPAGMPPERVAPLGPGMRAPCWPERMLPAYESEHGVQWVMECVVVNCLRAKFRLVGGLAAADRATLALLPRRYGEVSAIAPTGLAALHHDPDAVWSWRPCLYQMGGPDGLTRLGSQQELEWRWGLRQAIDCVEDINDDLAAFVMEQVLELRRAYGRMPPLALGPGERGFRMPKNRRKRMFRAFQARDEELRRAPELEYERANRRARELLLEWLGPQQRLDLLAWGHFFVRGRANRLYKIRPNEGAAIVDPATRDERAAICYHPEEWIPGDDVALALKLLIEQGVEGEKVLLSQGNVRPSEWPAVPPTADEVKARDLEEALA